MIFDKLYDEAEPLFRRALNIAEKSLGPDHPSTILYRNNYRIFLGEREQQDEAAALEGDA